MRVVVAVTFVSVVSGVAGAETTEETLKRGVRAYATAKFRDAIRVLTGVAQAAVDEALRVRALKYISASHLAVGNRTAAREAIVALLGVDPTATSETGRFPQRLLALFDEVRKGLFGKVVVACDRPETRVEVAERKPSPCGDFESVPIGQQVVKATTPDEPAITRSVVVHVGKVARVEFKFGAGFGFVSVATTPAAALVSIDGTLLGAAPLVKQKLVAGKHVIVVRADGYRERTETIDLARGATVPLSVALERVPVVVAPPMPAVTRSTPPVVTTAPVSGARRTVGWTLVVTGAAAFVTAAVLQVYAAAVSAKKETQNEAGTGSNSTGDMKSFETVDRIAKGIFIGAGVTALAGTIVLLVRGKPLGANPARGASVNVGALPTLNGAATIGVATRWAF